MPDPPAEQPAKPEPKQRISVRLGPPVRARAFVPSDLRSARAHRFFVQTLIGALVAGVVAVAVVVLIALVMVLALQGRSVEYIKGVVESLQPYILPAFGVLVGYALGRKPDE